MNKSPDKDMIFKERIQSEEIADILSKTKKIVSRLTSKKGHLRDVKELKRTVELLEQAIIESNSIDLLKYKLVFDNINTGIGFSDTESKKIIELNPKFCEIFEIEPSDYIGTDYGDFFDEFISDKRIFDRGKEIYKKSGEIYGFELAIKTKTGGMKYILAFSIGIPEIGQEFFTVIDITKQKSIEKLREDTENILNHDLKGPIVSIGGNSARLISKFGLSEKPRKIVESILSDAQRMEDMINSHFELMQMEQGKYQIKYNSINLVKVIKDLRGGFEDLKILYNIKVSISYINKPSSGDFVIVGDRKWISSLFSNLLKNAIEHSCRGEAVKITFEQTDKETILVKISNKQPVPMEIRDRIMVDKYVTCGKSGGTGLGIYSAKLITESHNGKISIETSDEKGTTVSVSLKILGKMGE